MKTIDLSEIVPDPFNEALEKNPKSVHVKTVMNETYHLNRVEQITTEACKTKMSIYTVRRK